MELEPIEAFIDDQDHCVFLLTGVGPVECAVNLSDYLARVEKGSVSGVINVGLAGAYPDAGIQPLDICLARKENFGDIGICMGERVDELDPSLSPPLEFEFDSELASVAAQFLTSAGIEYQCGNFVTVSSVSGTSSRGIYLRDKFSAICENMEGAAVARICQKFSIPLLELRCISNMAVDRKQQIWQTKQAIEGCCRAIRVVIEGLADG